MNPSSKRRKRLTVFVTVLALFLFTALLVGSGVTITNYVHTRQTAVKVASDVFDATIDRINERRLAFFAPAFLITEQLRNSALFRGAAESREAVQPLILVSLTLNPQISAVYAGYENGNYFQVLSISESEKPFLLRLGGPPSTRFAVQEIRSDNGAQVETWRFLDSDHREVGTLSNQLPTYDPRRRDWYRDARAKPNKVVRTPPYIFATTSQAGMTLAKAFEGGVVGVDITLDRLMTYVRSVRLNERHRFLGFDEENRLLAHFDPDRMFKRSGPEGARSIELATTADLVDPVVREALQFFRRNGPFRLAELDVAGTSYLATVVRQVARDGGVFFVLYAAPLSDFEGTLADAAARTIPAALLIFVLALPAIILPRPLDFEAAPKALGRGGVDTIVPAG